MFKTVVGHSATLHGSPSARRSASIPGPFAGSDDAAFVYGDFAMLENELQPVLRAMRKEGMNIVAIHKHMSHEQPRYFFLHYWGKGKVVDLAQSLRRILDAQAAVKSQWARWPRLKAQNLPPVYGLFGATGTLPVGPIAVVCRITSPSFAHA